MKAATLNGQAALALPDGAMLAAKANEEMDRMTVGLERAGETIWTSQSLALGPEPSRRFSRSQVADYSAVVWPLTNTVAVLGYSSAMMLDLTSGQIVSRFSLEFTGKASLEQAGLEVTSDGRLLLIASTKRVWVINRDLQPILRYEPRFILAGPPRIDNGKIMIGEYNFDDAQEVISQVIEL
jgi:hypothetical protein